MNHPIAVICLFCRFSVVLSNPQLWNSLITDVSLGHFGKRKPRFIIYKNKIIYFTDIVQDKMCRMCGIFRKKLVYSSCWLRFLLNFRSIAFATEVFHVKVNSSKDSLLFILVGFRHNFRLVGYFSKLLLHFFQLPCFFWQTLYIVLPRISPPGALLEDLRYCLIEITGSVQKTRQLKKM